MDHSILIIVISLLLSAFFSGMEIAYISANKVYLEIEKKQDNAIAKVLRLITKKPSKFIATMLIGNNIALVVYGFVMGDVILNWLDAMQEPSNQIIYFFVVEARILTQTLISTLIILFTAEFFPKVFFRIYANNLVKFFAIPAFIFYIIFSFISSFVIWISDLILNKFFNVKGDSIQLSFSKIELGNFINEQMEVTNSEEVDSEIQIFQNALEFGDLKAREVMIPRSEITAVSIDEDVDNLTEIFTRTGFSKILVYKESKDNIIGYVHSFEMFKQPISINNIILPVIYVPETASAKDVLNMLIKKRMSISVVIDEYGGTSGMMTVEDIVEELFGEIEDEHDPVQLKEEQLAENHFIFAARLEVDYLNETYKLNLPRSENYETLGGLVVYYAEDILEEKDEITIENFHITILEATNTKIDLIEIRIFED